MNWLRWNGYPTMFQWWCLAEWTFDGAAGWGEVMEYYPLEQGRRLLRAGRAHTTGSPGAPAPIPSTPG